MAFLFPLRRGMHSQKEFLFISQEFFTHRHIFHAADKKWCSLMQFSRDHIKYPFFTVACPSPRLLANKCKGIIFIHQSQFSVFISRISGVEIYASIQQCSMKISNQWSDIPRSIGAMLAFILFLKIFDIFLHTISPPFIVSFIYTVNLSAFRYFYIFVR